MQQANSLLKPQEIPMNNGQMSNKWNNNGSGDTSYDLKVILTIGSDKQIRFTGVPLRYLNESAASKKILA